MACRTTINREMTNANSSDNGAPSYRYSEPLELPLAVSFKHLLINGLSGWSPVLEIFHYSNLMAEQMNDWINWKILTKYLPLFFCSVGFYTLIIFLALIFKSYKNLTFLSKSNQDTMSDCLQCKVFSATISIKNIHYQ